jgi:hypothetical protein
MKVLMHALAASCEELRARTGNSPCEDWKSALTHLSPKSSLTIDLAFANASENLNGWNLSLVFTQNV